MSALRYADARGIPSLLGGLSDYDHRQLPAHLASGDDDKNPHAPLALAVAREALDAFDPGINPAAGDKGGRATRMIDQAKR